MKLNSLSYIVRMICMKLAFLLLLQLVTLSAHALTIGAYTIRTFDYDERYRIRTTKTDLASMLKSLHVDALSVEEINNVPEFHNFIASQMPGYKAAITECGGQHGQHLGFIYKTTTVDMLSFNEDLSI